MAQCTLPTDFIPRVGPSRSDGLSYKATTVFYEKKADSLGLQGESAGGARGVQAIHSTTLAQGPRGSLLVVG